MSYLRYLCLFGQGGVQHILFFALFFFVLCTVFVNFSGLSIFDCLFGIILHLFICYIIAFFNYMITFEEQKCVAREDYKACLLFTYHTFQ